MALNGFGPISKANNRILTVTKNTTEDLVNIINEIIQLAKDETETDFPAALYNLMEPKEKLTLPSELNGPSTST
jgi:hypothetical protein